MRKLLLATTFLLGGTVAAMAGEIIKVGTDKSVPEVMDALEAVVGNAGATIFARVDHAAGAEKVEMPIPANQVLIFGNPALGTPAMQVDPRAGLFLPLKVQAYEDEQKQVWLAYEDPKETLGDLNGVAEAPVIEKMRGALAKLTAAAAQ